MEPSTDNQPNFELPAPQSLEESGNQHEDTGRGPATPELNRGAEQPGAAAQSMAQSAATIPIPDDAAQAAHPSVTTPGPAITPALGTTADLIEKEWVEKAKAIVEQTRSDPHLQTSQISKFKASYIKTNFDKDIKVADEQG